MIEPHGGKLIERVVDGQFATQLRAEVSSEVTIELDHSQYQELINIGTGRFSPLTGFLGQKDFLKVVHDRTLEDGTTWTLPIILDVDPKIADSLTPGTKVGLTYSDADSPIGVIDVEEIYKYNKETCAEQLFGTTDRDHPGVESLYNREDFLVGGPIYLFDEHRYDDHDLFPVETRVLFSQQDWETVVGFQTRNAPHRAHEYIQKAALERFDGLLIQPKLGDKKASDYCDDAIMGSYQRLIDEYYPPDLVALSTFPSTMRYAGPREAVFDAIVRKNQGCTHFVVGRDHAGVGDYYDSFAAQNIFAEINDLGIEPLFYSYCFFCERCDGMTSEKLCPHEEDQQIHPSGTRIRNMIRAGEQPSEKIMRPEVSTYLGEFEEPFVAERKTECEI